MISGLYTAATLTGALGMVVVGFLLDRYGARVMLTVVSVAFGVAVAAMSLVDSPLQLLLGLIALRLLGQGSMTLIPTTLVSLWFVRLRGRAMSISIMGSAAGQATFPPLIHFLISILDWRRTWMVMSLIALGLLVVPVSTLVRRSPESVGTVPDGKVTLSAIRLGRPSMSDIGRPMSDWKLKQVLRLPSFWMLIFVSSVPSLVGTGLIFHHVSLLGIRGIDPGVAAASLSVMALTFLVGSLTIGFVVDALPNRYVYTGTHLVMAAASLWLLSLSSDWQAYVYGGILGLSSGFSMTVGSVIWANYYGKSHLGSVRGFSYVWQLGFSALGPLPMGLLFDLTDGYTLPVLLMLALSLAAAFASTLARPPRRM